VAKLFFCFLGPDVDQRRAPDRIRPGRFPLLPLATRADFGKPRLEAVLQIKMFKTKGTPI